MEIMPRCPKSYLLGYFFGDGSMKKAGKYFQACFYCNPEDLERVDAAAKKLGVSMNWQVSVKGKSVMVATWPARMREYLGLSLLERETCYTRRLSMIPGETDRVSFLEGFWDADGFVSRRDRPGRTKPSTKVGVFIVNHGLAKDLGEWLEGMGFRPHVKVGFNGKGESTAQVTINSRDYAKFKETFTLQYKKQSVLNELDT